MADGPVQTSYKGYFFRSRLEARWAVFMDCLGIEWRYEPEGFKLSGHQYLPDFYLPELYCWVEVKGFQPDRIVMEKAYLLADMKNEPVYIFWGDMPYPGDPVWNGGIWRCAPMPMAEEEIKSGDNVLWRWVEEADNRQITLARFKPGEEEQEHLWVNTPRLRRAFGAARSARFEFGETGCMQCQGMRHLLPEADFGNIVESSDSASIRDSQEPA